MTDFCRGPLVAAVCAIGAIGMAGCGNSPPGRTYYERNIEPILVQKCAGNTSGCHAVNSDDPYAFAGGNLDVTSFANVQKRRDVLRRFGPYPAPLLLIKAIAPEVPDASKPSRLQFQYGTNPADPTGNTPAFRDIEVLHAGGALLEINSDAYFALQTWLENGATENGLKPPSPAQSGNGTCSSSVPSGFNATALMANPKYASGLQKFRQTVQPILKQHGCTSSNCHGAPQSDYYITCGDSDAQLAFNFAQSWSFVTNPVDDSQLLRVPLAVRSGGRGHTGGDQFSDTDDSDYQAIRDWAANVGTIDFAAGDAAKKFFQDNVQPILIARGCSFEACHSPAAGNDFKLRSGTQGFFSAVALEKNYDLMRDEFMAIEFADVRRGRAVAKGTLTNDVRTPAVSGIPHRGGPVLETPNIAFDPENCAAPPASTTPLCVLQAWVNLERTGAAAQVTPMGTGNTVSIVYVQRPANAAAGRLEFDTFQGGADLRVVTGTFGANFGHNLTVNNGTQTSLIGSCVGLNGTPDIGRPSISHDGDSVVFAGRTSAGVGWRIYTVRISNPAGCAQLNTGATGATHDFDPTWSPDGQYIVFASTRGASGPTQTRVQPRPQSDLWRIPASGGAPEQVTVLSNSEVNPQFMREGRITMSTEKASDGFYQVSGRRINWDLTDYHPLLAQRNDSRYPSPADLTSTHPSVGYSSATDIREANNGDFLLILSDSTGGVPVLKGGAGALAVFNRSIGPFESGRSDAGYLPSMRILGPASASGRAGATTGFRAPFAMPDGRIMVSYASNLNTLNWDIQLVDPRTNTQTSLNIDGNGQVVSDAVLAYKYPPRKLYNNRQQLVFGGGATAGDAASAVVYIPDAPMLFTLLTGNLRRGRPIEAFRAAKTLAVYREGGCPAGTCSRTTNGIYQSRTLLGKAPLQDDGSVKVTLPARTGLVFELQGEGGSPIVTMQEEHQLGPAEAISMGVRETITNAAGQTVRVFDAVCGGCHGSVTGQELDVLVSADALTGASVSVSQTQPPVSPR